MSDTALRGVAIVCSIPGSILSPIFRDDAGRIAIAELSLPSLPPILVASVYAPAVREDRPEFFRGLHAALKPVLAARPDLLRRVVIGGDFNVCLTADDKQGGNMERVGSPELTAFINEFSLLDVWRVAHPGVQAWSHVSAQTATRIDLILASCAAAEVDMTVAPVQTDHRLVSATFGVAPPLTKRALLWRMHPSVLDNDAACSLVRTLLEVNGLLHDYSLWSQWRSLKRHIARILRTHATAAARERAATLTAAREDLERATAHVRQDASRANLQ